MTDEDTPASSMRPDWAPRFLDVLRSTANVRLAADAAGVARDTTYKRRRSDAAFAARWAEVIEDAIDVLEAEARRRALSMSDNLLMFLLKAHRPTLYRERVDVTIDLHARAELLAVELGVTADVLLREAERIAEGMKGPAPSSPAEG